MSASLVVTLTVESDSSAAAGQTTATCALVNRSAERVEVDVDALSSPSLAVEIVDAEGDPVLQPPPPVPPSQRRTVVVEPGQTYQVELSGIIPPWTPAGTYHARCRYVSGELVLHSRWVTVEVE